MSDPYNLLIAEPTGMILSIVTALVGSVALYIYRRQHVDQKRLAAQTIYSELSTAENRLKSIRERFFATEQPILESSVVMRHESWSEHKYLFLKDLTEDEWNLVDGFYNNCYAYDAAVTVNKENIQRLIQENYRGQYAHYSSVIEKYHKDNPEATQLPENAAQELLNYQALFLSETKNRYDYIPRQGVSEARGALVALDTSVKSSTAGQKLKQLAKL